jgi:hypothetical protein
VPVPDHSSTRIRLAQLLAFVALVVSLVGALESAEELRITYSWPPVALPAGTPMTAASTVAS